MKLSIANLYVRFWIRFEEFIYCGKLRFEGDRTEPFFEANPHYYYTL